MDYPNSPLQNDQGNTPHLEDGDLLAYLDGDLDSEKVALIEQSPDLLAEVAALAETASILDDVLYRSTCPPVDDLLLYQAGFASADRITKIEVHLKTCRHCQVELAELQQPLEAETAAETIKETKGSPLGDLKTYLQQMGKTILNALRLPNTPQSAFALRGEAGDKIIYQVEGYQLVLTITPPLADEKTRELEGHLIKVTETEETMFSEMIELHLRQNTEIICSDTVDTFGYFLLEDIPTGVYTIHLDLPTTAILIEDFQVL